MLNPVSKSTIYFNYDLPHETVLHVNPLPRVMHVSPGLTSVDYCFQPRHNAYASLKQSEALDVWLNWLGNIQKSAGKTLFSRSVHVRQAPTSCLDAGRSKNLRVSMLQTFNRPYIVSSFYIKTTSTSLLLWKSDPKSSSKKVEPPGEQNSMDPSDNLAFPSVNSPMAMVLEAAGDSLNQTVESHLHGIGSSSSSEGLCDKCSNIDFDKLIASYEIDRNHAFGIKEPQGHEHYQSYVVLYTSANRGCRLCQFF
jgi:hypothetical protein